VLPSDDTLIRLLSMPGEASAAREAARSLVASRDRQTTIERLYPTLIRHKTLTVSMDHIEATGADLEDLFVPGMLFRSQWPFSLVFASTPEARSDRVSLGSIRRLVATHEALLTRLEDDLHDADLRFLLLFGRALRIAFPAYRHGLSHDVDIFVPPTSPVVPFVEFLCTGLGFGIQRMSESRSGGRRLAHLKFSRITEEGHYLSLDMLCSGRPARALHPAFVPDLSARAVEASRGHRTFGVPCREDLLLMLVEKTHRRAEFIRRHYNDAAFILGQDGELDWRYLIDTARTHRLTAACHLMLQTVRSDPDGPLIPDRVVAALSPTRSERRLLDGMVPNADATATGPRTTAVLGARGRRQWRRWQLYWFGRHLVDVLRSPRAAGSLLEGMVRSAVLAKRMSRVNASMARRMGAFGTTDTLPLRLVFVADLRERGERLAEFRGGGPHDARTGGP
jgi:hypothetical protein